MIDVFEITAEEIETRANPLSEPGLGFSNIPAALITSITREASETVRSTLPEGYRRLNRHINGDIVVEEAYAEQTEFVLMAGEILKLAEADEDWDDEAEIFSNVVLYVDFGRSNSRSDFRTQSDNGIGSVSINGPAHDSYGANANTPYSARRRADRLAESKYTVNANTGEITLVDYALAEGQMVFADYDHRAMKYCDMLRGIAIDMIVGKLDTTLPFLSEAGREEIRRSIEAGMALLDRISTGGGIDAFDNLKLAEETRATVHDRKLYRWRYQ